MNAQDLFAWLVVGAASFFVGLVLVVLAVGLFPRRVETMSRRLGEATDWFLAFLAGMGGFALLPVLTIALVITVVGIVVVPFLWLGFYLLGYFGYAAICLLLGRRLLSNLRVGPGGPDLLGPAVVGYVVLSLLEFVPCFGFFFGFLLWWLGAGVALLTALGTHGGWAGVGTLRPSGPPAVSPPAPPPTAGG